MVMHESLDHFNKDVAAVMGDQNFGTLTGLHHYAELPDNQCIMIDNFMAGHSVESESVKKFYTDFEKLAEEIEEMGVDNERIQIRGFDDCVDNGKYLHCFLRTKNFEAKLLHALKKDLRTLPAAEKLAVMQKIFDILQLLNQRAIVFKNYVIESFTYNPASGKVALINAHSLEKRSGEELPKGVRDQNLRVLAQCGEIFFEEELTLLFPGWNAYFKENTTLDPANNFS